MSSSFIQSCYVVSAILFMLSLSGLSHQETAKRGNLYGILGMIIAISATAATIINHANPAVVVLTIAVATAVGGVLASRVAMTAMPELVALLHSFVGLAAVLVGFGDYLKPNHTGDAIHLFETVIGVFIGGITFTGSLVAFGKLRGAIGGRPLLLPGRHVLNAVAVLFVLAVSVQFVGMQPDQGLVQLLLVTGVSLVLGVHLVMAIGGADMPVVVSLLNSYSGWAAAASGFMLSNSLLIITGALVGSSGAILSYIMCKAMNRSIVNVIFGGFGAAAPNPAASKGGVASSGQGPQAVAISAPETAQLLQEAKSVVIVPGYGMAVAQAQYPVREITERLRNKGVQVRFAIHPVAGRLPGHMNVLLAEASVPYDIVLEMDEINGDMPQTDVILIIGANDIVNPSALDDTSSPIYGMPVIEVWKAKHVVMMKRSMAAGYAGIENPLCFKENTRMLFGDAKATVQAVLAALQ